MLQVSVKGKQVAILTDGEYFGEVSLYHNRGRRSATVQTGTYCQIFSLSKVSMEEAFSPFPVAYAQMKRTATQLWQDTYTKQQEKARTESLRAEPPPPPIPKLSSNDGEQSSAVLLC